MNHFWEMGRDVLNISRRAQAAIAYLPLLYPSATIQSQVDMPVIIEELFQHIQHAGHLGENQDPVGSGLQLP